MIQWYCSVVAAVTIIHASHAAFLLTSPSRLTTIRRIPDTRQLAFLLPTTTINKMTQRRRRYMPPLIVLAARATSTTPATDSTIDASQDPFIILGIDPTADAKAIQRAYKRRALQYHPDVVTTKDSSKEDKKLASDRFAKINWAYATLTGKGGGSSNRFGGTTAGSSSSNTGSKSRTSSTSSTSSSSWTPPHRRSTASSYSSSTTNASPSTDWRDYMPKYENEEVYDTGGDSLGAIFSDLIMGVASGGRGVMKDFVEFLENNFDGYGSSSGSGNFGSGFGGDFKTSSSSSSTDPILNSQSLQDVGNEMDDTELLVQQLNTKVQKSQDEILTYQAELTLMANDRYLDKLQVQEKLAEAQARQKVAQGYLKTARQRLLALQTKYKQLLMQQPSGRRDDYVSTSGRGSSGSGKTSASSSTRSRTDTTTTSTFSNPKTTSSSSSSSSTGEPSDSSSSWKRESFGSFGRGRSSGSSSRGRRSPSSASGASTSNSYSSSSQRASQPSSSSSYSNRGTSNASSESSTIPPHRRREGGSDTTSSSSSRNDNDQKRLREVKIEEEFQKLKQQVGDSPKSSTTSSSSPWQDPKQSRQRIIVEDEFEKLKKELGQ